METLIFSIKFFLKIAGVVMASYLGTQEPSKPISQLKNNTIELTKIDTIEKPQDILKLKADSVQVNSKSKIESNSKL